MNIVAVTGVQHAPYRASRPLRATDHLPDTGILRGEWLRAEPVAARATAATPPLFATAARPARTPVDAARAIRAYTAPLTATPARIDFRV